MEGSGIGLGSLQRFDVLEHRLQLFLHYRHPSLIFDIPEISIPKSPAPSLTPKVYPRKRVVRASIGETMADSLHRRGAPLKRALADSGRVCIVNGLFVSLLDFFFIGLRKVGSLCKHSFLPLDCVGIAVDPNSNAIH